MPTKTIYYPGPDLCSILHTELDEIYTIHQSPTEIFHSSLESLLPSVVAGKQNALVCLKGQEVSVCVMGNILRKLVKHTPLYVSRSLFLSLYIQYLSIHLLMPSNRLSI